MTDNKITCAIVDDEPISIQILKDFVERTSFLSLSYSFSDSVEAISMLCKNPVDLVFLDIQMPDLDGMELSHMLPPTTRIIFTTAFKEYAFDSYEVSAIDFLLKPIRYAKFLAAAEKAKLWYDMQRAKIPTDKENIKKDSLFIRVDGSLHQIAFADIVYVEGLKDYVKFYIDKERRPLISHLTMKYCEEILPPSQFMRINRSYIVSLNKIKKVDRNNCIYIGDEIIHVTDSYLEDFNEYIDEHLKGK